MFDKIQFMSQNFPKHVAIIPDGNRRWAKEKGLPLFEGHRKGAAIFVDVARAARNLGIHTLTIWGFSTENWSRSKKEINNLMKLYEKMVDKNLKEAKKEKTRIYHLGRKDRLPLPLLKKLVRAEKETKGNQQYVLNLAIDYGGQDEIIRAVLAIIKDVEHNKISPQDIYQEVKQYQNKYPYYRFKNYLDTKSQPYPYPDLLIRTSGEKRISGYLLWQAAYSELYFESKHFPDFTPTVFKKALQEYSKRKRRFGGN